MQFIGYWHVVNMSVSLLHGEVEEVCLASKGHNFLVTGQGGTGKSTVVGEIISNL